MQVWSDKRQLADDETRIKMPPRTLVVMILSRLDHLIPENTNDGFATYLFRITACCSCLS